MSLFASWPSWPKKVSPEAWKKAYGIRGKSIETNHKIAAQIDKLEAADKKITRAYFWGGYVEHESLDGVTKGLADIADDMKNYEGFSKQVTAFNTACKKAGEEVKKSTLIPKEVRVFLETMVSDMAAYDKAVVTHIKKTLAELKDLKKKYESEKK